MASTSRPKLRRLERQTLERDGERLLVIRDPLELCEPFAIDHDYAPVLDALDGQRTVDQVRQSLMMRGLATVDREDLHDFVADLGDAGLLDDDRFRALWAAAHEAFVETERRAARRAGLLYPEDAQTLRTWLAPILPSEPPPAPSASLAANEGPSAGWTEPPLAVVVPHQPPPVLGPSLRRLLANLGEPERYARVVILATDHSPGLLPYASADKDWETPLGLVPADLATLAALDSRVPWLLREQIRLRTNDPSEWAALLLRALWGERCPPIVPIACGQTRLTTKDGRARSDELTGALEVLLGDPSSNQGRTLWWTAAELSHLGPAFGHASLPERAEVLDADRAMLAPLLDGKPHALAAACMEREPSQRPSGTAALVTLAELLPLGYRAHLLDQLILPAPGSSQQHTTGWIGAPIIQVQAR
ncbi:hypothetical protein PPSIR1_09965 [Plesiocystis pacifica SIR-1]|uniref:Uncharacterized protein n=1 Tax=Plesiocystis pacifica SIR-1 TaxID=391625 RepID=A6G9V3_9BACT|nr:AmmeMemoRadiSam system protein B [Plesiocystis pacifica]EDM77389.1 hypothetical protein PPSIR1_09965 [Plesiocystis pacifica SIR-1]